MPRGRKTHLVKSLKCDYALPSQLSQPLPEIFNGLDFIVAIKEELCAFSSPQQCVRPLIHYFYYMPKGVTFQFLAPRKVVKLNIRGCAKQVTHTRVLLFWLCRWDGNHLMCQGPKVVTRKMLRLNARRNLSMFVYAACARLLMSLL